MPCLSGSSGDDGTDSEGDHQQGEPEGEVEGKHEPVVSAASCPGGAPASPAQHLRVDAEQQQEGGLLLHQRQGHRVLGSG